jgi:prolyl oligopeptidase
LRAARYLRIILAALCFGSIAAVASDNDPYLWLADIHGARALAWAKDQTAKSDAQLKSDPIYRLTHDTILRELDVQDRIPLAELDHSDAYNFWQDKTHVRGVWRVTNIADYAGATPLA